MCLKRLGFRDEDEPKEGNREDRQRLRCVALESLQISNHPSIARHDFLFSKGHWCLLRG
jgi:hypothetical protein